LTVRLTLLRSGRSLQVPRGATGPDGRRSTMAIGTRTQTAGQRRNPRAGGRPKIDWGAARSLFVSDVTMGLGDVARQFNVSYQAVKKHHRAECRCCPRPWDELRAEAVERVEVKRRAQEIRTLEERQQRTIKVAEKLRDRVLGATETDLDLTAAIRTIPRYATLEQLYEGEATERIAVAEVQTLIAGVLHAARMVLEEALGEEKANGKRVAVLGYFDTHLPRRVAELVQGTEGDL
jgi:hypothetical protein